jgi:hypothetical protein
MCKPFSRAMRRNLRGARGGINRARAEPRYAEYLAGMLRIEPHTRMDKPYICTPVWTEIFHANVLPTQ